MKTITLFLTLCLAALNFSSCSNTSTNFEEDKEAMAVSDLKGTWVLQSILLGDMMDLPCGIPNEGKVAPVTLTFTDTKSDSDTSKSLNGSSIVNQYFGSYTILSYDEKTKVGKMKVSTLGSTKMASSSEFMNCESRYFSLLENAVDFQLQTVNGKTRLELGKLFETRPGIMLEGRGNLLYFEKQVP